MKYYKLIDELGHEIDYGSLKRVQKACSQNSGSRIEKAQPKVKVKVCGWQEVLNGKPPFLLVNLRNKPTVKYNPQLHTI